MLSRTLDIIQQVFPYEGYGGHIDYNEKRTTCILGRFNDRIHGLGTSFILKNLPYDTGNNPGGLNLLNLSPSDWSWEKNKNWLIEAIEQKHVFRLVSDINLKSNQLQGGNISTILSKEYELLSKAKIL